MFRSSQVKAVGWTGIWPTYRPLPFPASLMSEKIHPSSKEYNVDVVPSILGDEGTPVHLIDPKILRRASLKIDLSLIPIVGMFREPYL
jgi:hypothetical protein